MNFHPHIHTVVLGGGLDPKNHWKDNGEDFFLPIRVVSRLFRGKYLAELKQLWEDGKLEFHGSAECYKNHYALKELLDFCYKKEWIPYCKKPFDGAESVIKYLGKYTHRIAISNYRIKSMTDNTVTFTAKDYKNQGQWKEVTITGEEFIRRFLMHVPPKRFVRIRHYGLLSSRNKNRKITLCRNLLGCRKYLSRLKGLDAPAIIQLLYNKDVCKCSSCGGKNHSFACGSVWYKQKVSHAVLKIPKLNTLEKLSLGKAYLCCLKQVFFITSAGSFLTLKVYF